MNFKFGFSVRVLSLLFLFTLPAYAQPVVDAGIYEANFSLGDDLTLNGCDTKLYGQSLCSRSLSIFNISNKYASVRWSASRDGENYTTIHYTENNKDFFQGGEELARALQPTFETGKGASFFHTIGTYYVRLELAFKKGTRLYVPGCRYYCDGPVFRFNKSFVADDTSPALSLVTPVSEPLAVWLLLPLLALILFKTQKRSRVKNH